MACRYSNTDSNNETVKLLLEKGADVNIQENDGWSALMMACKYNDTDSNNETIQLLLDYDPDTTIRNKSNKSVYDLIKNNSYLIELFHTHEKNKSKKKIQQMEKELDFYKKSFDLHPDGIHLSSLKDKFFSSV